MRSLTVLITGFCVLWHSLLGCCAAHPPTDSASGVVKCCTKSAAEGCTAMNSSHCEHSAAHESAHKDSTTDSASDHRTNAPANHECRHEHCQWLAGDCGSPSIEFKVEFIACVCFSPQAERGSASFDSRDALCRGQSASRAPLRLYLEFGAILI